MIIEVSDDLAGKLEKLTESQRESELLDAARTFLDITAYGDRDTILLHCLTGKKLRVNAEWES